MTVGNGPPSSEPFASLGPDGWSLRTHPLCWDLTTGEVSGESSPAWPKQGMTRGGDAFELPTLARRTDVSGSSSLLPTPTANNYEMDDTNAYLERRERCKEKAQNGNGFGLTLGMAVRLLPTPTSRDHKGQNQRGDDSCLPGALALLPTPTARLGDASGRGADPDRYKGPKSMGGRRSNLDDAMAAILDGRFPLMPTPTSLAGLGGNLCRGGERGDEMLLPGLVQTFVSTGAPTPPAIAQWSRLFRPAPHPVDGRGRLSPEFVGWMMGCPDGWVDVPGVSRSAQLRILGNSVQVQVAEAVGLWVAALDGDRVAA